MSSGSPRPSLGAGKHRLSSILKPPKQRTPLQELDLLSNEDNTSTVNRMRRVSFGSSQIKEFQTGADTITVWGSSYEEALSESAYQQTCHADACPSIPGLEQLLSSKINSCIHEGDPAITTDENSLWIKCNAEKTLLCEESIIPLNSDQEAGESHFEFNKTVCNYSAYRYEAVSKTPFKKSFDENGEFSGNDSIDRDSEMDLTPVSSAGLITSLNNLYKELTRTDSGEEDSDVELTETVTTTESDKQIVLAGSGIQIVAPDEHEIRGEGTTELKDNAQSVSVIDGIKTTLRKSHINLYDTIEDNGFKSRIVTACSDQCQKTEGSTDTCLRFIPSKPACCGGNLTSHSLISEKCNGKQENVQVQPVNLASSSISNATGGKRRLECTFHEQMPCKVTRISENLKHPVIEQLRSQRSSPCILNPLNLRSTEESHRMLNSNNCETSVVRSVVDCTPTLRALPYPLNSKILTIENSKTVTVFDREQAINSLRKRYLGQINTVQKQPVSERGSSFQAGSMHQHKNSNDFKGQELADFVTSSHGTGLCSNEVYLQRSTEITNAGIFDTGGLQNKKTAVQFDKKVTTSDVSTSDEGELGEFSSQFLDESGDMVEGTGKTSVLTEDSFEMSSLGNEAQFMEAIQLERLSLHSHFTDTTAEDSDRSNVYGQANRLSKNHESQNTRQAVLFKNGVGSAHASDSISHMGYETLLRDSTENIEKSFVAEHPKHEIYRETVHTETVGNTAMNSDNLRVTQSKDHLPSIHQPFVTSALQKQTSTALNLTVHESHRIMNQKLVNHSCLDQNSIPGSLDFTEEIRKLKHLAGVPDEPEVVKEIADEKGCFTPCNAEGAVGMSKETEDGISTCEVKESSRVITELRQHTAAGFDETVYNVSESDTRSCTPHVDGANTGIRAGSSESPKLKIGVDHSDLGSLVGIKPVIQHTTVFGQNATLGKERTEAANVFTLVNDKNVMMTPDTSESIDAIRPVNDNTFKQTEQTSDLSGDMELTEPVLTKLAEEIDKSFESTFSASKIDELSTTEEHTPMMDTDMEFTEAVEPRVLTTQVNKDILVKRSEASVGVSHTEHTTGLGVMATANAGMGLGLRPEICIQNMEETCLTDVTSPILLETQNGSGQTVGEVNIGDVTLVDATVPEKSQTKNVYKKLSDRNIESTKVGQVRSLENVTDSFGQIAGADNIDFTGSICIESGIFVDVCNTYAATTELNFNSISSSGLPRQAISCADQSHRYSTEVWEPKVEEHENIRTNTSATKGLDFTEIATRIEKTRQCATIDENKSQNSDAESIKTALTDKPNVQTCPRDHPSAGTDTVVPAVVRDFPWAAGEVICPSIGVQVTEPVEVKNLHDEAVLFNPKNTEEAIKLTKSIPEKLKDVSQFGWFEAVNVKDIRETLQEESEVVGDDPEKAIKEDSLADRTKCFNQTGSEADMDFTKAVNRTKYFNQTGSEIDMDLTKPVNCTKYFNQTSSEVDMDLTKSLDDTKCFNQTGFEVDMDFTKPVDLAICTNQTDYEADMDLTKPSSPDVKDSLQSGEELNEVMVEDISKTVEAENLSNYTKCFDQTCSGDMDFTKPIPAKLKCNFQFREKEDVEAMDTDRSGSVEAYNLAASCKYFNRTGTGDDMDLTTPVAAKNGTADNLSNSFADGCNPTYKYLHAQNTVQSEVVEKNDRSISSNSATLGVEAYNLAFSLQHLQKHLLKEGEVCLSSCGLVRSILKNDFKSTVFNKHKDIHCMQQPDPNFSCDLQKADCLRPASDVCCPESDELDKARNLMEAAEIQDPGGTRCFSQTDTGGFLDLTNPVPAELNQKAECDEVAKKINMMRVVEVSKSENIMMILNQVGAPEEIELTEVVKVKFKNNTVEGNQQAYEDVRETLLSKSEVNWLKGSLKSPEQTDTAGDADCSKNSSSRTRDDSQLSKETAVTVEMESTEAAVIGSREDVGTSHQTSVLVNKLGLSESDAIKCGDHWNRDVSAAMNERRACEAAVAEQSECGAHTDQCSMSGPFACEADQLSESRYDGLSVVVGRYATAGPCQIPGNTTEVTHRNNSMDLGHTNTETNIEEANKNAILESCTQDSEDFGRYVSKVATPAKSDQIVGECSLYIDMHSTETHVGNCDQVVYKTLAVTGVDNTQKLTEESFVQNAGTDIVEIVRKVAEEDPVKASVECVMECTEHDATAEYQLSPSSKGTALEVTASNSTSDGRLFNYFNLKRQKNESSDRVEIDSDQVLPSSAKKSHIQVDDEKCISSVDTGVQEQSSHSQHTSFDREFSFAKNIFLINSSAQNGSVKCKECENQSECEQPATSAKEVGVIRFISDSLSGSDGHCSEKSGENLENCVTQTVACIHTHTDNPSPAPEACDDSLNSSLGILSMSVISHTCTYPDDANRASPASDACDISHNSSLGLLSTCLVDDHDLTQRCSHVLLQAEVAERNDTRTASSNCSVTLQEELPQKHGNCNFQNYSENVGENSLHQTFVNSDTHPSSASKVLTVPELVPDICALPRDCSSGTLSKSALCDKSANSSSDSVKDKASSSFVVSLQHVEESLIENISIPSGSSVSGSVEPSLQCITPIQMNKDRNGSCSQSIDHDNSFGSENADCLKSPLKVQCGDPEQTPFCMQIVQPTSSNCDISESSGVVMVCPESDKSVGLHESFLNKTKTRSSATEIEELLRLEEESGDCNYTIGRLTSSSWSFLFVYDTLELLVSHSGNLVTDVQYTVVEEEVTDLEGLVHQTLLRKFPLTTLKGRCTSVAEVPNLLNTISSDAVLLESFLDSVIYLKKMEMMEVQNLCAEWNVLSLQCHLFFKVKVDLCQWENICPTDVTVTPVSGDIHEEDIKQLASTVKKGPCFLLEYVDCIKLYVKNLEELKAR